MSQYLQGTGIKTTDHGPRFDFHRVCPTDKLHTAGYSLQPPPNPLLLDVRYQIHHLLANKDLFITAAARSEWDAETGRPYKKGARSKGHWLPLPRKRRGIANSTRGAFWGIFFCRRSVGLTFIGTRIDVEGDLGR